ncbi:hypothetical protein BGX38DRAFT_1198420 [Terfezia claveryi]|nr:hypothetical protein BGX38DRAFT_1236799 [Terfezia claveryi]KAF8444192.1 hypothetical protein BGX38DRAFT_1198420 [Terfezia claveryi]
MPQSYNMIISLTWIVLVPYLLVIVFHPWNIFIAIFIMLLEVFFDSQLCGINLIV